MSDQLDLFDDAPDPPPNVMVSDTVTFTDPLDQDARDRIKHDLAATLFVEAGQIVDLVARPDTGWLHEAKETRVRDVRPGPAEVLITVDTTQERPGSLRARIDDPNGLLAGPERAKAELLSLDVSQSPLPPEPDRAAIDALCQELLMEALSTL